jgi:hypothetical protein
VEHRWGRRTVVDLPVRLVLSPGIVVWGRVRNVSMTGALVHSAQPLPAGALVSIEPMSGIGPRSLEALEATVIWTRDGGAGLEWCEPMDSAPWRPLNGAAALGTSMRCI